VKDVDKELQLDHINGDMSDNRLENLRLAHQSCNSRAYHYALRGKSAISYLGVREIKIKHEEEIKDEGKDATALLHEIVNYEAGPPEMQVTEWAEIAFRNWLTAYLKVNKRILKKEAIASGAEIIGCSIQTTFRYLQKMISQEGPLTAYKDMELKKWFIIPKPETLKKWEEGLPK
jgi:hypothetical protein